MLHYTVPQGTNFDCTKVSGTTLQGTGPRSTNFDCNVVAVAAAIATATIPTDEVPLL